MLLVLKKKRRDCAEKSAFISPFLSNTAEFFKKMLYQYNEIRLSPAETMIAQFVLPYTNINNFESAILNRSSRIFCMPKFHKKTRLFSFLH